MFSQNIKNPESNEIYRNSIFSGLPEFKKITKKNIQKIPIRTLNRKQIRYNWLF